MSLLVHAHAVSSDNANATTGQVDSTGAKFLVAIVANYLSAAAPTDSYNNAWLKAKDKVQGANSAVSIWYVKDSPIVGPGHTVAITGQGSVYPSIRFGAFSQQVSDLDQTASNGSASSSSTTGSVTPTTGGQIIIDAAAVWGTDTTPAAQPSSINASQAIVDTDPAIFVAGSLVAFGGGWAYEEQTTATPRNPTWTGTANTGEIAACIATFKTAIVLNAAPSISLSTVAALTAPARFASASVIGLSASANLTAPVPLSASATVGVSTSAPLRTTARFAASLGISVATDAHLIVPLQSASSITVSASGSLSTGTELEHAARVTVTLAGVELTHAEADTIVRNGSLSIHDVINDAPNTCDMDLRGTPLPGPQRLRVTLNLDAPRLLFDGSVQAHGTHYIGTPENAHYPVTGIDDSAQINRRRPFGTWVATSASTIWAYNTAVFAEGFTGDHIQADLPEISIVFDGTDTFMAGLARTATLIGGYCFVEDEDVFLFTDAEAVGAELPDDIDETPGRALNDPPVFMRVDESQLRTRVYGKGNGSAISTDILAGESVIPIDDATMFNPDGGAAIVGTTANGAQSQIIAYDGVQLGGPGALVGPGAGPSVAPSVEALEGGTLTDGERIYAYTDVTAAGESIPSPLAKVQIGTFVGGFIAPPTTGPTPQTPYSSYVDELGAIVTGNIRAGVPLVYTVAFKNAAGQTTVGPSLGSVTLDALSLGGVFRPASSASWLGSFSTSGGSIAPGSSFFYGLSYITSLGETDVDWSGGLYNVGGNTKFVFNNLPVSSDARVTGRKLYRSSGGSNAVLITTLDNVVTTASDGTAAGAEPLTINWPNTTARGIVDLANVPIGPVGTTGRVIYRNNGRVGTISNNTATTFRDNTASEGDASSLTNTTATTSTVRQVKVTGIARGATGTTQRKLYRTVANGTQLKYHSTIANNVDTANNADPALATPDTTPDASLGANAPTSDLSGLTGSAVAGFAVAGATSIPTSGSGPFPPEGGWVIASGDQRVRFSGISGNTLTGIPSSGPGSIGTTILYGSQIFPAPALTGISTGGILTAESPLAGWADITLALAPADGSAIALDAVTDAAGASASYSHTTAGADRVLTVWVQSRGVATALDVTAVTYNGVALTLRASQFSVTSGSWVSVWTLTAPATGAHTVAITTASGTFDSCAISYTGCRQTGIPDAVLATGNTTRTTQRIGSVVTDVDGCWTMMATINDTGDALSANALSTVRRKSATAGSGFDVFDSNGPSDMGQSGALLVAAAKGSRISIWVQRDDLDAQATQAAIDLANGRTPADGVYEGPPIVDDSRDEASLIALCDATLQLYSRSIKTVTGSCRDVKIKSGKPLFINMPRLGIGPMTLTIQEVAISEIGVSPGVLPRYTWTASTVRHSLDDILRKLIAAQAA